MEDQRVRVDRVLPRVGGIELEVNRKRLLRVAREHLRTTRDVKRVMQRAAMHRDAAVRARFCRGRIEGASDAVGAYPPKRRRITRRRKEIRRTSGNVRREIEHELRRSGLHGEGVETVGGGHGVRCASVDRDGPLADPARDADLIGERFRRPDRRGKRVPERVERVHSDGDFVRCETEAEVCQSRVAMPLTCLGSCERRALY